MAVSVREPRDALARPVVLSQVRGWALQAVQRFAYDRKPRSRARELAHPPLLQPPGSPLRRSCEMKEEHSSVGDPGHLLAMNGMASATGQNVV